jgi:NAD-dependent SIR2 family protein deacetylase
MAAVAPLACENAIAEALSAWLAAHARVFVLTGAGISTASGIPDYRGPDGQWKRRAPITYQAFVRDRVMRARYWARSFVGWPAVARARPNAAHDSLATLEQRGRVSAVVTQNVDGLHARAGQLRCIDLHGRIDQVICLDCGERHSRAEVQQRLSAAQPRWTTLSAATAPDGDADLEPFDLDAFEPPACLHCGGLLKPDVVFFGENVPHDRVADAQAALAQADAMLVIGSSLMVYSGYRFARLAHDARKPLALLTRGITRADDLAALKLDGDCVAALAAVAA